MGLNQVLSYYQPLVNKPKCNEHFFLYITVLQLISQLFMFYLAFDVARIQIKNKSDNNSETELLGLYSCHNPKRLAPQQT